MTRTPNWIAIVAATGAIAAAWAVAPAGAASVARWSNSHCQLQQARVQRPPPAPERAPAGRRQSDSQAHGCAQRVPGPKHWSKTQCSDYQATFAKLNAFPSDAQLATANTALKNHGCSQRVTHAADPAASAARRCRAPAPGEARRTWRTSRPPASSSPARPPRGAPRPVRTDRARCPSPYARPRRGSAPVRAFVDDRVRSPRRAVEEVPGPTGRSSPSTITVHRPRRIRKSSCPASWW